MTQTDQTQKVQEWFYSKIIFKNYDNQHCMVTEYLLVILILKQKCVIVKKKLENFILLLHVFNITDVQTYEIKVLSILMINSFSFNL